MSIKAARRACVRVDKAKVTLHRCGLGHLNHPVQTPDVLQMLILAWFEYGVFQTRIVVVTERFWSKQMAPVRPELP